MLDYYNLCSISSHTVIPPRFNIMLNIFLLFSTWGKNNYIDCSKYEGEEEEGMKGEKRKRKGRQAKR